MKKHIFIIIIICFQIQQLKSQTVNNELQAKNYLDRNFYDLERIEGIYSVDVEFSAPTMYCQTCEYESYIIKDFDRVGIIKSSNGILQYSYTKSKTTGAFKVENINRGAWHSNKGYQYSYKIEGINDQFRLSSVSDEKIYVYGSNFSIKLSGAELEKIGDFFGFETSNYLNINCDPNYPISPYEKICYSYDITFIYNRIFPLKDYIPSPQVGYGTGFVISNNPSLILTNYHVIKDYEENTFSKNRELKIIIQDKTKTEYKARIYKIDKANDIAILEIYDDKFKGFPIIPYKIQTGASIGQNVFTLGYPLTDVMGQNIKLSTGMITGTTGIDDNENAFTLDLNLNPGNSGGPLFNNKGEVVGIVSSRLNEESLGIKVENVSYAIKAEKFNLSLIQKKSPNSQSILQSLRLEDKIKKIKPFIVIIKVRGKY
jgi:S1-C subfamily serine protease